MRMSQGSSEETAGPTDKLRSQALHLLQRREVRGSAAEYKKEVSEIRDRGHLPFRSDRRGSEWQEKCLGQQVCVWCTCGLKAREDHTWRPWAVRGGKNSKDHHVRPSCSAWASFSVTFILRVSCRSRGGF